LKLTQGRGQEPPDVTWPEPELDDGGGAEFRPVELEPELPVLERPEPEVLLLPAVLCDVPDVPDVAAGWALAALARPAAMPPPARTLAAPMVAVTARSRARPRTRSRAAVAAGALSLPLSTADRPSAEPGRAEWRRAARMAGALLRGLCCGCGAPANPTGCGWGCG
jgi:hypothetical protein